jgi:release factor glutamine methyltransferase
MKISAALKDATEILQKNGIEESRREASSLLAFALQRNKTFLIAHDDYLLNEKEQSFFKEIIERRANREPFQYIIGKQEFFGLDFIVTPDVLIPRPETEIIVENAIEILRSKENPTFCEVGIGSGCISVSILHEIKFAISVGLDISEKALQIADKNAEKHKVIERLNLQMSDVFSALDDEKFDLIVSNPPYIPSEDIFGLQPEVRDHEPLNALTDGENGLSIIERIITQSPKFLKSSGCLLVEIGFNQSAEVENLFDKKIWRPVEFLYDLQAIPRTVKAVFR